jgi:hypothetical protein
MKKLILFYRALYFIVVAIVFSSCAASEGDNGLRSDTLTGTGGSLARFTIACDNLFVVDNENLKVFDISKEEDPVFTKNISIGFGIETIFPHKNSLFIGANDGMYIFDITDCSNPEPTFQAKFVHVMSCDPVVATDEYAYVTLRSSGDCRIGFIEDELQIIDITDLGNPQLAANYPMMEPYGLGIDGNHLFICQGDYGLFVYDVSNPYNLLEIKRYENIHSFDCIPRQDVLMVVGKDGLYQLDYSDIYNIKQMSVLKIGE